MQYRYLSTVCVQLASLINDKQHDDDVHGGTVVGEMLGSSLRMLQFRLGMDGPCRSTKQGSMSDFVSHTWRFLVSFLVHIIPDRSCQLFSFMRYTDVRFFWLSGVLFPREQHHVVDFVSHTWQFLVYISHHVRSIMNITWLISYHNSEVPGSSWYHF